MRKFEKPINQKQHNIVYNENIKQYSEIDRIQKAFIEKRNTFVSHKWCVYSNLSVVYISEWNITKYWLEG